MLNEKILPMKIASFSVIRKNASSIEEGDLSNIIILNRLMEQGNKT